MARGKALVALLRANPKVRDPEALAAYAGRVKKHRGSGLGPAKAREAARKTSGGSKKSSAPKKPDFDDDDPFNEDYGDDGPKSEEERQQEKYEAKILRDLEKAERSRAYAIVQEAGGLRTRDDLREEYSEIPNTYKRRDGTPGDEMAEYFKTYYPEFGIEDERDLIDFLAA